MLCWLDQEKRVGDVLITGGNAEASYDSYFNAGFLTHFPNGGLGECFAALSSAAR